MNAGKSRMAWLGTAVAALVAVGVISLLHAQASGQEGARPRLACPLVAEGVGVEIANIRFEEEVTSINGVRLRCGNREMYRVAVVTLKITKPAGERLTLAAADLTLHYYHGPDGEKTEVAPCEGISSFSVNEDDDRALTMYPREGPGWLKQTTSARSTAASTVYIDAVFNLVERDIRETWAVVGGRPVTSQPYLSVGWGRQNTNTNNRPTTGIRT